MKMRGSNLTSEAVEKRSNSILDDFERYLNWQRPNADNFVTELRERARQWMRTFEKPACLPTKAW